MAESPRAVISYPLLYRCHVAQELALQFLQRFSFQPKIYMANNDTSSSTVRVLGCVPLGVIRVRISDPRFVWIMVHQRNRRVRSFGMIRVRISDPRSVWIMVHQRNRRIHDQRKPRGHHCQRQAVALRPFHSGLKMPGNMNLTL